MTSRTWALTTVAVAAALALFIGAGSVRILKDVRAVRASETEAREHFAAARASFRGQPPVLRLSPDGWTTGRTRDQLESSRRRIESVHALVWDTAAEQLVEIRIPFWFLRYFPTDRPVTVLPDGTAFGLDELVITIEDLRRYGPGLIVDHTDTDGSRAMIWAK